MRTVTDPAACYYSRNVPGAKTLLFLALSIVTLVFFVAWVRSARNKNEAARPGPMALAIGFITNFFDTLGIGSFAPTTSIWKLKGIVPDERIPGTLNVGHALPTIVQAFIFIAIVEVEMPTLVGMIAASVAGAWLGAGVVAAWPRRKVQIGMGLALLAAATFFAMTNLGLFPAGGETLGLRSPLALGRHRGQLRPRRAHDARHRALRAVHDPRRAARHEPASGVPDHDGLLRLPDADRQPALHREGQLQPRAPRSAWRIGGIPAVLLAAFVVKSLPLTALRWLVFAVVLYTAAAMLRSARGAAKRAATP